GGIGATASARQAAPSRRCDRSRARGCPLRPAGMAQLGLPFRLRSRTNNLRPMPGPSWSLLFALAAALPAQQDWRAVDGPSPTSTITYDPVCKRVQVLDQRHELYEASDKSWLLRPAASGLPPAGDLWICRDPVRRCTVALDIADHLQPMATFEWNGS